MIELYTGTPGSGKSLHMAKTIKEHLQSNKPAVGNFQINYDFVKPNWLSKKKGEYLCYGLSDLTPQVLIDLSKEIFSEKGKIISEYILLVIDESQLYFNSRDWNSKSRRGWLEFFSLHRHYGYHIILVAQDDRMLDRQIRTLIELNCVHRSAKYFGITGFILNMCVLGGLHVAVNHQYLTKLKLRTVFFKCKKSLYSLYDTYALFDD